MSASRSFRVGFAFAFALLRRLAFEFVQDLVEHDRADDTRNAADDAAGDPPQDSATENRIVCRWPAARELTFARQLRTR